MSVLRALRWCLGATVATALTWVGTTLGMLFDPVRGRVAHAVMRAWARVILLCAGARLVVRDGERYVPGTPCVVVANHASWLDIPAITAALPGQVRIVAKRSLRRMPFVGWHIALGGHFSLDRDDPRQALALLAKAGKRLRSQGLAVLVFAEGTRSPDGRLAALKPGAFLLALQAQADVLPVAVLGSHAVLPKGAPWPKASGTVEVRVGQPIRTAGLSGGFARRALAQAAREALLALGVPEGGPGEGVSGA